MSGAAPGGAHHAARPAVTGTARVGLCTAWLDPADPASWSGITHNLIAALERMGVYAGSADATPWLPGGARLASAVQRVGAGEGGGALERRVLRPWLQQTGRAANWSMSPEVRLVGAVGNALRRLRSPADVDGWVVFGAARAVAGRYVTLFDVGPAQFSAAGPGSPAAHWTPGATPSQVRAHVRRLAATHRRAHACCAASHWARRSLVEEGGIDPGRVHVVGFGHAETVRSPSGRDWSTPRFLFVGRDWARKNGDALVRAFVRLRERVPTATLDLVGDHPALSVDGVTGHGELSRADPGQRARLDALFGDATCLAVPSLLEPFGIVYLEAAAHGVPSIAGSAGGTGDSVGNGGILVDPADEGALLDAMARMADPGVASSLGRAALARAPLFTWDKVAERVVRALGLPGTGPDLAPYL